MALHSTHVVTKLNKKRPKKKSIESDEPATSATPISDPSVSDPQRTAEEKERERAESLRLEEDLDAAVRNASFDDGSASAEEGL